MHNIDFTSFGISHD